MRRRALLVMLALAAALVVGCGGDDDDGGGGGGAAAEDAQPTTLTVGVIPIADVAPLYLGMDQGFFEEENLTIEPQLAEGGAAIVPAVVSGDYQIGFSNTTSLIIARSKDLPVKIITQGAVGGTNADDAWNALMVPKGSDITEAGDLEGKTVAVNTLNNVGPLTINTAMANAGADFTKIKYVEVSFPDMNAALEAGRVDAAWMVEPAYSGARAADGTAIFHPYEETAPNLTVATYFTTEEYISENQDVVERFKRAMEKSLDYAAQNPDAVRTTVGNYTEIPPEVTEAMHLPLWQADLNESTIERTIELAGEYGFIEEAPSLDDLIQRD